ncbi:hypothetical protein [Gracilimonas sediminicola]|uniref:Uncharacterized protein n=1 Tax=Gracilimonas sediminicola TaxID=2952158 RepID=A0A9X2RAX0_9BACT|nr:hypothetical protein [Gracilimonas sediminicola]MCP9290035.1 hypothetical protein [Gracilimonas sediminicola]
MDSWKEVPHLFANGKFKGLVNDVEYLIIGLKIAPDLNVFCNLLWEEKDKRYFQHPDDFTLIARPIEDLSDEELSECENIWHDMVYYHDDEYCISAKDAIEIDCEAGVFSTIMHLLSIGVYPFDQSHFESGEVIARYENKGDE